ncbi:MAG: M23 family metallopeptidase [Sandaracinus sp.]
MDRLAAAAATVRAASDAGLRRLRIRRKLRGSGPFLLAGIIMTLVLGPRAPAAADLGDEETQALAPVVEAPAAAEPVEAVPAEDVAAPVVEAVPSPELLTEQLHLGTRLTALQVMRLPPNPQIVEAAQLAGETPEHLLWPVATGHFGRGFGYTRAGRPDLAHLGVDINAPTGDAVVAAADGVVVYAGDAIDGFGNFIVIVHPNGWGTSYAHNSEIQVRTGQLVHRGEQIALVGATGLAHGPHVHFEFYRSGAPADPTPLFEEAPPNVERMVEHAALEARLHPRRRR